MHNRRKIVKRKLRKQGDSLVLTIPPETATYLNWDVGDEIGFELAGTRLILFKVER